MSTAKEKGIAYFEEWAATKEIRDGFTLTNYDGMWQLYYQGLRAWHEFTGHESHWEIAARILKLDKPRAAEIQWREVNEHHWVGREYSVEYRGSGGWAAYCGSDRLGDHYLFPSPEAAKKACQDHKQERLEELL